MQIYIVEVGVAKEDWIRIKRVIVFLCFIRTLSNSTISCERDGI